MGAPAHAPTGAGVTPAGDDGALPPLTAHLARRIALTGPLTVADYMADALGHPTHGYYVTRDPLGRAGDFVTAPEISQVFGELIGLWCADLWLRAGRPDPVRLVELGPGRGTLLADLWRAVAVVPAFRSALRLHLVETSPVLRAAQARTLTGAGAPEPVWHDHAGAALDGPVIVIANEFLDALPIRQFQRTPRGWRERRVTWDGAAFRFGLDLAAGPSLALIPDAVRTAAESEVPPGTVFEANPTAVSLADALGRHVAGHGLAALLIDYGHGGSCGDTLQAVAGHRYADPLADPGRADLTAHVDFAAIARAGQEAGATIHGPTRQADWLHRLGLAARVQTLCANQPDTAAEIRSGADRLTAIDPSGMGALFKVLALTAPGPVPAGFADAD